MLPLLPSSPRYSRDVSLEKPIHIGENSKRGMGKKKGRKKSELMFFKPTLRKLQPFLIYPESWEKGRASVPMWAPNGCGEREEMEAIGLTTLRARSGRHSAFLSRCASPLEAHQSYQVRVPRQKEVAGPCPMLEKPLFLSTSVCCLRVQEKPLSYRLLIRNSWDSRSIKVLTLVTLRGRREGF